MLNTDLHNPNIRADKRMSMEGFVQNNANYGQDISGNINLPRDFLESLYASIRDDPINTSGGGPHSAVTVDRYRIP